MENPMFKLGKAFLPKSSDGFTSTLLRKDLPKSLHQAQLANNMISLGHTRNSSFFIAHPTFTISFQGTK
jgi:hypothetical protein